MYYIYRFTNLINNKVYIGMTSCVERRYDAHIKIANGTCNKQLIHKAIHKYGIINFKFEILSKHYKFKNCCDEEIKQIKKHNSTATNFGYNIMHGGSGSNISIHRKFLKEDIKEIFKYYLSSDDVSIYDVVKKFHINKSCVKNILDRISYVDVKIHYSIVKKTKLKRSKKTPIPLYKRQLTSKLSQNDIKSIFNKFSSGKYTLTMLIDEFNLNSSFTIKFILNRQTWKNVEIDDDILIKAQYYHTNRDKMFYDKKLGQFILKSVVLNNILLHLMGGVSIRQISNKEHLSAVMICDILYERNWKDVEIDNELLKQFKLKYPQYLINRKTV